MLRSALIVALLASTAAVGVSAGAAPAARKQLPDPVRVVIPSIGINARIVPLGLNRDHTMQVPRNRKDAGWFRPGPEPGEVGSAVVVGHLATLGGPGVFARLSRLQRGGVIEIRLQGGGVVRFVATSMLRVAKVRFPTRRVYARTAQPTLRLITCAGRMNPATGHHADNYIVFASLLK